MNMTSPSNLVDMDMFNLNEQQRLLLAKQHPQKQMETGRNNSSVEQPTAKINKTLTLVANSSNLANEKKYNKSDPQQ